MGLPWMNLVILACITAVAQAELESPLSWILGEVDEDCHTTCRHGGGSCHEEVWPMNETEWMAIVPQVEGLNCKGHYFGTWPYNPAICVAPYDEECTGNCFWAGAGPRCKGGMREQVSPIARRVCPCLGFVKAKPEPQAEKQTHTKEAAENIKAAVERESESNVDQADQIGKSQVVLDDSGASHEIANAVPGTYAPCMKDAYNGQYHHDKKQNKGEAHFTYRFDPSKSGCYLIEEHHPGSDEMCAQYLPSNAQLDVDYCKGYKKTYYIDQGSDGAQWNPVGKHMFYEGYMGNLTMRNAAGEQCRTPPCLWVADAFRLTWMEQRCRPDGELLLNVRLGEGSTAADVLLKMKEHKSVLKTTLEAHFSYQSVHVLDIAIAGRRLGAGDNGIAKFSASLLLFGAPETTSLDLGQALQKAFLNAGAGVQIESAAVDWKAEPVDSPTTVNTEDGENHLMIVLICIGAAALLTTVFALLLCRLKMRRAASKSKEMSAVGPEVIKDLEDATGKDDKVKDKVKDKTDDWELESASTATPVSDPSGEQDSNVDSTTEPSGTVTAVAPCKDAA